EHWLAVASLALVGTLLSTAIVAGLSFWSLKLLGVPLAFGHCLLFGAIISPTDPVAVLGILKQARVPRTVAVQIGGESLFNDGVGVVLFTTIAGAMTGGHETLGHVGVVFVREALGGIVFGLASGYLVFHLLRSIDHYQTELLLTLALVLGGYAVAERLHLSAAIAAVVAGLVVGNHGREQGMSDVTRDHLDKFWSLVDEILNALLFVMMGLEVAHVSLHRGAVLAGAAAIPVVLVARWVSVGLPVVLMGSRGNFAHGTVRLLTWGGLRGGISLALALALPGMSAKSQISTMTYVVVAFSILAQGLTLGRVARRYAR
ncbi:MAG TPA: sodium:proton antiporter, partial [Polyangiaceae bacterium]|nr:sodium:proton antiporter [Polyangiaceae bacterium]